MGKGIVLGLIVSLTAIGFAGFVSAGTPSFNLFGNAITGWGSTSGGETMPGPTMTVNYNDVVTMHLFSDDGIIHQFYIDINKDGSPDAGDVISPTFTTSTTFMFTANVAGTFPYRCVFHPGMMFGTWVTNPPPPVHDIAVTSVTTDKTQVVQGGTVNVTVQVKNLGNVLDSTTVSALAGASVIGTQSVTLSAGQTQNLLFPWNTATYATGNYTISGRAAVVPGETNTSNNQLTDGTVWVQPPPPPPPGNLRAALIGKSAWPDHHHFSTSRFGAVIDLFGKIGNTGPGTVDAMVRFTIRNDAGAIVGVVDSDHPLIPVGQSAVVTATWTVGPPGKYHVTAQCFFDSNNDGLFDMSDPGVKTFAFAVVL